MCRKAMSIRVFYLGTVAVAVLLAGNLAAQGAAIGLDTSPLASAPAATVSVPHLGALEKGVEQTFTFDLPFNGPIGVTVTFADAPFEGARLDASINGHRLLPYHAFGGDTRYDAVKGKPGMRPPIARMEANYVLVSAWLKGRGNRLTLSVTGGPVKVATVQLYRLGGHNLPYFQNPAYFDFDVWPTGWHWKDDKEYLRELVLLGVLNGAGMRLIIPSLGTPNGWWGAKRGAEQAYLNWGYGHQEFYTIWEFSGNPGAWAKFTDVDGKPETFTRFPENMVQSWLSNNAEVGSKGADIVEFDVDKYVSALEEPIRHLAPYTDYYNFKCEQYGAGGAGFGSHGNRWAAYGIGPDRWANNYADAESAAHALVLEYNPERGRIQSQGFWSQWERELLYNTALKRGRPMSNFIDILMTHYQLTLDQVHPELQYPGGVFTAPNLAFPEIALDFNRYRLSRTEKDMVKGDPKVNRWSDGRPFDYRAGCDGDELIYNSEGGAYVGYGAPAPYQFLYAFFSYGLLPTASSEPTKFGVTQRTSPTETQDLPINLYGSWVSDGPSHTHRLRTQDPLYGDLFGWTGLEFGAMSDYIDLPGLKDPHHQHPPNDAYQLVRRTCYAFITSGRVYPLELDSEDSLHLIVKCLVAVVDGHEKIALYAVNFDNRPHRLRVSLPVGWEEDTRMLVLDDRASDWTDAVEVKTRPKGGELHYRAVIPPVSAWSVFIDPPAEWASAALGVPPVPWGLAPPANSDLANGKPDFSWSPSPWREPVHYEIQIASEALFRPQDIVETAFLKETAFQPTSGLNPQSRYFWRVRAIDESARSSAYSPPHPFTCQWPEYAASLPKAAVSPPPPEPLPQWQVVAEKEGMTQKTNLARKAELFATTGYMRSPSLALDGIPASSWDNLDGARNSVLPVQWTLIFPTEEEIREVKILWDETAAPKAWQLQASDDGQNWRTLLEQNDVSLDGQAVMLTQFRPEAPLRTRFLRIWISEAPGKVGIREVFVR